MIFFKHHSPLFRWKWLIMAGCKPIVKLKLPKTFNIAMMLLLITCFKVTATANAQMVNLSLKDVSLQTAFSEIKKQTGFSFWYDKEELDKASKISVSIKNASIQQVLEECLKGSPFTYEIFDKTIVIKRKAKPSNIQENNKALDFTVKGKVIDEQGSPMSGVTVRLKNTNKTTQTNSYGEFSIEVSNGTVILQFNYLGYTAVERAVDSEKFLDVTLLQETNTLKGVEVNAGYYKVNDRERTGSISKITSETIEKQSINNPLMALQGRVTGMEITQLTGVPGGGFKVQIRGRSSINNLQVGNEPLYVIDGVVYPSTSISSGTSSLLTVGASPLSSINPYDIESIEVLKDADATSIYGTRGANGVVLITTKKGASGAMKISVNASQGISKVPHRLDLLDTEQYLQMRTEAFKNDGLTPAANQYDINGAWGSDRYTDWQEELIGGTANNTNVSLNISGGGEQSRYILGANYYKEGTVFPGDFGFKRISLHSNLNIGSKEDRFQANFNVNYSNTDSQLIRTDPTSLIFLSPNTPNPFDEYGNLTWLNRTNYINPMSYFYQPNDAKTNNLIGNVSLNYKIIKNLVLKTSLGYNTIRREEFASTPLSTFSPALNLTSTSRASYFTNNYNNTWLVEPQLDYNLQIGKGKLQALIGMSFQENVLQLQTIKASGYNSDELLGNLASASLLEKSQISNILYRYNSLYTRVNYSLNDKYFINLTARRDGSSRFGNGKQFANFGALGTAWIFSNENFFKEHLPFLNFGKLRASYGITGNDQIPDYGYLELWSNNYAGTYQGQATIYPTRISNPYYAWEVNKKSELGLQLALFQNRLNLEISFYRNTSSNQLVGLPLPLSTGFQTIQANLPAKVRNSGLEFLLGYKLLNKHGFKWETTVNLTIPKNKLIAYPDLSTSVYADSYIVGQPLSILKTYNVSVDSQTGLYSREDYDGNGVLNTYDRYLHKFTGQYFYGGLQNSLNLDQFSLDFLISFNKQNGRNYLAYTGSPGFWSSSTAAPNQPIEVLNRWQNIGDQSSRQKFSTSTNARTQYLNAMGDGGLSIVDASYIRLKNVSLSYRLPVKLVKGLKINDAQIYLQAQNLFTLTNYVGLDPESQGLVLPPLRTIMMGLNLKF
ncbi:SusC/RagA family TonB-linked outer membrane protein [Pedobacter sp. KBW01]|uniref:SusC/RagA family TonB-linked outer membrane protein n=1 Tax=Pedobacter sp. KBW01 TaxID=2153364 RepID=UPI000F59153B|nr:SusC/RagA family TonB-linked outer membrane protein [Pedobacter sp. KBW01]RQO79079.1 SusC/RagA family TonB-linked outer membrane protein [Pedobacter sp. KBW01]